MKKTLNLLYLNIFNIETIYIFKKIGIATKLIRILKNHPEIEKEPIKTKPLLDNFDARYFEPFLPQILDKLSSNNEYLDLCDIGLAYEWSPLK